MRGKQDCGENQANGDGPDQFCCCKFFTCEQSDFVEKLGDTQSFKSTGWIIREAWWNHESKFQSRRSVEFSRMANGCSTVLHHRETNLWQRWRLNTKDVQENSKFKKIQEIQNLKVRIWQRGESLLEIRKKDLWSENDGQVERPRCEHGDLGCLHVSRWISRSVKNQSSKSVEQWFPTTEKLIKEQTETTGVSTINWDQRMWRESSLLCDRAVRIVNSQTDVFSDSVLCLGGISTAPVQAWKDKMK